MSGLADTQTTPATSRRLALPCCPRCDDMMFASTAAEFVSQSRVRHQWSCESCGHEFSTSVQLSFHGPRRVLS
jgi:transcription elongation factor Elf1